MGDPALRRNKAFTLIELLVVISIIALLIGILLPALGQARAAAQGTVAASNQRQIAIAMHAYTVDNNGWFPTEIPVDAPDNPSGQIDGGSNIFGMSSNWVDEPTDNANNSRIYSGGLSKPEAQRTLGLGVLCEPGSAVGSNRAPEAYFGNYIPVELLFSPDTLAYRRGHENGDPFPYFGYEMALFDGSNGLPLDPGGYWWSGGNYGPFYMTSSFVYRHGFHGTWDGEITGGIAPWSDIDQSFGNLLSEAAGLNDAPIVVEQGGWHPKLRGGNYMLRDGSVHWWSNEWHAVQGWYSKGGTATVDGVTNPLGGVSSGIFADNHHGIHQNLVFSAIERDREGLSVPGE